MIVLALAGGLVGLVASLVLRVPKRRQAAREGVVDDRFAYLSLPGFSLFLIGIGLLGLTLPGSGAGGVGPLLLIVSVLAGIMAAFGALLSMWGLFGKTVPRWALPRDKR